MIRLICALALIGLASLPSRGDDDADRARRVRVALALSCGCDEHCDPKLAKPAVPSAWLVTVPAAVEVAPPPKVAKAKESPAPPPPPKVMPPGMVFEPTPYAEVLKRVAGGEKIQLLVRPAAHRLASIPVALGFTTVRCDDAPASLSPGRWECWLAENGQPVMVLRESYLPIPLLVLGEADPACQDRV